MKFAFLLLFLAILFPKFGVFLIQRLTAFLPLLNALMPASSSWRAFICSSRVF